MHSVYLVTECDIFMFLALEMSVLKANVMSGEKTLCTRGVDDIEGGYF